jgi:signal transduction histidine kinase
VSYQPTDLAVFTREIASEFDSAMRNASLRFSVECQSTAEPVYVDRDMWEKIVLNLVSNALKFTLQGEVALTLKPVNGAVELQVRDTGVGIPEEHHGQLFERFHRIEGVPAKTFEGSGIGTGAG